MKVKIGNYPTRMISNLYTGYMDKTYGWNGWPTYKQIGLGHAPKAPWAEVWREKAEDTLQWIYDNSINLILDKRIQTVKVRIDRWDTWSMDDTLAFIILPMLVQLKETTHGYPSGLTEEGWNEILDEMIWAFDQKCNEAHYKYEKWDSDDAKAHRERMLNGFKLFGEYYQSLWD